MAAMLAPPRPGATLRPWPGSSSIDNYDSFVYNLVQYLGQLGRRAARVPQRRHRRRRGHGTSSRTGCSSRPGPGRPDAAGVSCAADRGVRRRRARCSASASVISASARSSAAEVVRARGHARQDVGDHATTGEGCSPACRTRSWPPATTRWWWHADSVPAAARGVGLEPRTGPSWALRHRTLPVEGVQFHPGVDPDRRRPPAAGQLAGPLRPAGGARHRRSAERPRQRSHGPALSVTRR